MTDERTELPVAELARWLALALLLAAGIAAFFLLSPRIDPMVTPGSVEVGR